MLTIAEQLRAANTPQFAPPGETGGNRIHLPLRDREILGLLPTTAPGITVREIIESC